MKRRNSFLDLISPHGAASRLHVRWEPSPNTVVDEMLRITEVKSNDILYDLGCGDGRIVLAAVATTGCRGVGIDLDPKRIEECLVHMKLTGQTKRVTFLNQDLFEADISEASIVTLFLFPDVNLTLRPKLLNELRPGTRIVSYCHRMEPWQPDRIVSTGHNFVYYWMVPGNMSGMWNGELEDHGRRIPIRFELEQSFQKVHGRVRCEGDALPIEDGGMAGDRFTLRTSRNPSGRVDQLQVIGRIRGNAAAGKVLWGPASDSEESRIAARREPATATPLEE
jgi:hypothetical protein